MIRPCFAVVCSIVMLGVVEAVAADRFLPPESLNLKLDAPIDTWDEAIPLGQRTVGRIALGRDNTIRLSLDRGDLWDLRVQDEFKRDDCTWKTIQRLVAEKNQAELVRRFDAPYNAPGRRSCLAAGSNSRSIRRSTSLRFRSILAHAVGRAELGQTAAGWRRSSGAAAPVAMMRIPGPPPKQWKLIAPAAVKSLGLSRGHSRASREARRMVCAGDGRRTSATPWSPSARREGDATLLAVTIATSADGRDPVAEGRQIVGRRAAMPAIASMLAPHEAWWREFWRKPRGSNCPSWTTCGITTWCSISTGPLRGWARRRCRCRACGRPTTADCRRGKATITTI